MRIVFVCEANSTRSQLAEGIARRKWKKYAPLIESCGNFDGGGVNPFVKKILFERGIDYSVQYSKSYRSLVSPETIDWVVILCGRDFIGDYFKAAQKINQPLSIPGIGLSLNNQTVLDGYRGLAEAIDLLLDSITAKIFL